MVLARNECLGKKDKPEWKMKTICITVVKYYIQQDIQKSQLKFLEKSMHK